MDNIFKKFKNALDRNFEEALVENESIVNRVLFQIEIIDEIVNEINKEPNIMVREVIYDLETSIYFGLNGLYRNAYISLRSGIELSLSYIYFVDHNYDYMFWKKDKYDYEVVGFKR